MLGRFRFRKSTEFWKKYLSLKPQVNWKRPSLEKSNFIKPEHESHSKGVRNAVIMKNIILIALIRWNSHYKTKLGETWPEIQEAVNKNKIT